MGVPAAAAVLVLLGLPLSANGLIKGDIPDQDFLTGSLTWDGTNLGIAWNPAPATRDPGGTSTGDDPTGAQHILYQQIEPPIAAHTGNHDLLPPPETFTSDPLPFDVPINVARKIRLDLYRWNEGQTCQGQPKFDVRIMVGPTLLTGGMPGRNDDPDPQTDPSPPVPPGYCLIRFRFHSELDHLKKDDKLTLTITHLREYQPSRYGMGPGHRSVLMIPFFPPEEALFRAQPSIFFKQGTTPTSETEGEGADAATFALAAMGLAGVPRRRARFLAVVAVLLLSGCTSSPSAGPAPLGGPSTLAPGGDIRTTIVPNPGPVSLGNGSLAGLVLDEEVGLPIPGVRASLLTFDSFAVTTRFGRFTLDEVPAGTHRIRVFDPPSASGAQERFHPFEGDVTIVAGSITRAEILLKYVKGHTADQRPHFHDGWPGPDKILVPSTDVTIAPVVGSVGSINSMAPCATDTSKPCFGPTATSVAIPIPTNKDANLVLPGTADVEVALDWDSDSSLERVGVGFRSFDDRNPSRLTTLYPRGRGEVFHIRSAWEMADPGHTRQSYWALAVYLPEDQIYSLRGSELNAYPTITATAKIVRGVMPLEPPHPDPWQGNMTLLLGETSRSKVGGPCSPTPCGARGFTPTALVPVETRWVEVRFEFKEDASGLKWETRYRTANESHPAYCPEYTSAGFPMVKGGILDEAATNWTIVIPVEALDPDLPYAPTTRWCGVSHNTVDPQLIGKTWRSFVVAHRDAPPEEE